MTKVERDSDAEMALQDTLDNGGKVWVIMMDQWVMILMEICHEILLEK